MVFAICGTASAQTPADLPPAIGEDADLYAAAYACGEEPDADRLKATVLLLLAGSGVEAATVGQARQQFLDQLRARMRNRTKLAPGECDTTRSRLKARFQALEARRIEPAGR